MTTENPIPAGRFELPTSGLGNHRLCKIVGDFVENHPIRPHCSDTVSAYGSDRVVSKIRMRYARNRVQRLFAKGAFRPIVCEVCSRTTIDVEGHHPNYDRESDVVWVCRLCHKDIHRNPTLAFVASMLAQTVERSQASVSAKESFRCELYAHYSQIPGRSGFQVYTPEEYARDYFCLHLMMSRAMLAKKKNRMRKWLATEDGMRACRNFSIQMKEQK